MVNDMFFKREKRKIPSFAARLDGLKKLGIENKPEGAGKARVFRAPCVAVLEDRGAEPPAIHACGILVGEEIGVLWSGGYQMFFATPSGRKVPALAPQLEALHEFKEDLKEGLDEESFYNEGLGTTSALHMYDRVEDRDSTAPKKPWEIATEL